MDQARIRPAQVGASTAAAVGGAFLASRLGVYGTIIGVGVISLMSTVGSAMLLHSLDRTKQAARSATPKLRMTDLATPVMATSSSEPEAVTIDQPVQAGSVPPADTVDQPTTVDDPVVATTEQPATAALPATPAVSDETKPAKARRWPIIAGGSLASFGLALAVIAGIETFTGQSLDGEDNPTFINVFHGDGQRTDDAPSGPANPTDEPTPAQDDDSASPDDPEDGTVSRSEPTSPAESSPPDESEITPPDDETPPPDGEDETPDEDETPPPDEETPPPDDEETPPPDEETPES